MSRLIGHPDTAAAAGRYAGLERELGDVIEFTQPQGGLPHSGRYPAFMPSRDD